MSCLPFAAWAAKKAAQIVGESGSSQPVVIDLTKYVVTLTDDDDNFPSSSESINDFVVCLASYAPKSIVVLDNTDFWQDVSTDRPIQFLVDGNLIASGVTIAANADSIAKYNGLTYTIEFSLLVEFDAIARLTVWFSNNFNGTTKITVVVESIATT